MIAETSGGWSEAAEKIFKSIAHAESLRTGGDPGAIAERYFQNLSVSIRRANACATLRRRAGAEELAATLGPQDTSAAALLVAAAAGT